MGIYSQCQNSGIKTTSDEFDNSTTNEIEMLFKNKKNEQLRIDISYHSTPYTRSGQRTPSISISARLLNRGPNPRDVGNNPYIHFLFEDGTSSKLYGADHIGHIFITIVWLKSFNTKSEDRLDVLKNIKVKSIKAIRFKRSYDDFDFYLNVSERISFKKIINCITKI